MNLRRFSRPGPSAGRARNATPLLCLAAGWGAFLGCALVAPLLSAQTNGAVSSSRYLLVVDTSVSMRPRAANLQNLVGNLLASGMNGQLHPGDTIGTWTFNDEVYTGRFPLQRWVPGKGRSIAGTTVGFLRSQSYEKQARLGRVIERVQRLVANSDRITVLLFSDGSEAVSGTPFDSEINDIYVVGLPAMRKARMPLVTVLRAVGGKFTGYSVNMGRWPIQFPEFPPRLALAAGGPESGLSSQPAAQPLIVIGRKPDPGPANQVSTNGTAPASTAALHTFGTEVVSPPATPATSPPGEPTPAPVSQPDNALQAAVPGPGAEGTDSIPSTVAGSPRTPVPAESPSPVVATAPVTTLPVETAVSTPPNLVFGRIGPWFFGLVLLVAVVGLIYGLVRRSRATIHPSLITRSMDKDKQ